MKWHNLRQPEGVGRLQIRSLHFFITITFAIVIALYASVALGTSHVEVAQAQEPQSTAVGVAIEAPTAAKVGEAIKLRLYVESDTPIGGMETLVLYPRAAAEFAGFAPALPAEGTSVAQLAVPEMAEGSAVGFYTCATAPCMKRRDAQIQAAADPTLLAEIELLPLSVGSLEIKLAHLQLVDPSGLPLAPVLEPSSVVIQVGEGGQAQAAPADPWSMSATNASAAVASVDTVDMTRDGAISHGDLMEVALTWQSLRESAQPCSGSEASADINGDGCVDIKDVQSVAAFANSQNAVSTALVQAAASMTFTVNSTLDEYDTDVTDGICQSASSVCTLRAAIQQANANPGSDLILFAIPGSEVHTIQLASRLPALWDETGGTVIDGYSQPGSLPNSDPLVSNAQIRIEIRGDGYGSFDGLPITSANNVIKGLSFYNLKRSLWIYGSGAYGNVITGNFVGTNAAGTFAAAAVSQDQAHGIHVEQGALGNRIGGPSPAERNIISGNARHGVGFWHVGTDENVVINNIVGLSPDGLHRIPNHQQGVDINYGASYNTIGGTEPTERNVISGNSENGAEITHGEETTANVIQGNFIGTDVTGEAANASTSNGGAGVSLHDRIMGNLVINNVVGNNRKGGVLIDSFGNCCTTNNRIEANWIGVSPTGRNLGNGIFGVRILANQSRVGPGNFIAYNTVGIQIEGDDNRGNTVTENSIFSNTALGIDLVPIAQINLNDEGDADTGANGLLNFPVIQSVSPSAISGTSCGGCRVEVFIADQKSLQYGEGKTFVGAAVAGDDGTFSISLSNVAFGDYLTTTATDIDGNTSEFSRNVLVPNPDNQPPSALDDSASTHGGIPITIDVLANDADPEGNALFVVAVGTSANAAIATNGVFVVYTPTLEFEGVDSFTYIASDDIGGSSVATVTVSVAKNISGTNSPGVLITPNPITLSVEGQPVSYTLTLESQPSADVTINIIPDLPLAVTPQQIVFTSANWEVPQSVNVNVVVHDLVATSQLSTVRHNVISADATYNNLGVPNLEVTISQATENGLYLPSVMRQEQ